MTQKHVNNNNQIKSFEDSFQKNKSKGRYLFQEGRPEIEIWFQRFITIQKALENIISSKLNNVIIMSNKIAVNNKRSPQKRCHKEVKEKNILNRIRKKTTSTSKPETASLLVLQLTKLKKLFDRKRFCSIRFKWILNGFNHGYKLTKVSFKSFDFQHPRGNPQMT